MMEISLKKIIGPVLGNCFVFNLLRLINRKKLFIIYYHRVVKKEEVIDKEMEKMCIDVDNFDAQMKLIKKCYHPVSEEEVLAFMKDGRIDDYAVWITFDDGWKDNYINAFPILMKYGIPATLFVTTGYINKTVNPEYASGGDIFMNWQEIEKAAEMGISIGAHAVSHRVLSDLSDNELEKEIMESKNEIERRLGKCVISFAYPVGKRQHYYLEKCSPILKKNNFRLAVNTIGGFNAPCLKGNLFNLRRTGLSYEDTLALFRLKISLGGSWQT
jgi:peptidoglycan/xylan/chitin deacetylase (PgdA/CDA1 family)